MAQRVGISLGVPGLQGFGLVCMPLLFPLLLSTCFAPACFVISADSHCLTKFVFSYLHACCYTGRLPGSAAPSSRLADDTDMTSRALTASALLCFCLCLRLALLVLPHA
jgi:hypothetical protein